MPKKRKVTNLLALAVLLSTAGCKSNQDANNAQTTADASQAPPPDSASDPASANVAPVSNASTAQQAAPADTSAPQQAAPPPPPADNGSYSDQSGDQGSYDDADYGQAPDDYATQPPPALPEYQQPPSPGDDYLWTPGYWGYASAGYYWVPGVWVQAPYQGALWTPGYWGPHIGFYGGVNYGFGYVGQGYQGGYWNAGHFFYNRSVNNINITVVHNVYNRTVIVNNNVHVAFNGGPGGINLRPRPAEIVAIREPHAAPMTAQLQVQRAASVNHAAFISVNHGRPATVVIEKPVMADRDVRPVVSPAARNMRIAEPAARPIAPVEHPAPAARPGEPARVEPNRPAARPNAVPAPRTEPARPESTRPAERAAPARPAPARTEPARPAERPAPARPQTEERSAPRPAAHPAPAKPAPHEPAKPEPKRENERPQ